MTKYLSQIEFSSDVRYRELAAGNWKISYSDETHLKPNQWRSLLDISVNSPSLPSDESERSFSIKLALDEEFTGKGRERFASAVRDAISLSATRVGLLSPLVSGKTASQLLELRQAKGVVFIPDTNSLYNGTLLWLLNVLKESTVWILPFVMSLTQMQAREASLKAMLKNGKDTNLGQAFRSRAMVNAGLGFLERNQHRYQVMELDPSLLRYMRTAGKGGFDQDDGEVLEDRLLIEGVHSVLRSTRTRAKQLVVTSDVLLSRVLSAEGIQNVCLPIPQIGDGELPSFRYDAWASSYAGTSVRGLLWDLAHTFGTVRISSDKQKIISFSCYWPGKLPQDWTDEHLDVRTIEAGKSSGGDKSEAASPNARGEAKTVAIHRSGDDEMERATTMAAERSSPPKRTSIAHLRSSEANSLTFSDAAVPQSSLPLALRLAAVIYATSRITLKDLLEKIPAPERPAAGNAQRALEVLRRSQLIDFDGVTISARSELDALDGNLRRGDLDAVSRQFLNFPAYKVVLDHLREHGELSRDAVRSVLAKGLRAEVAQEASVRLVRYHVLLGQCWSDRASWRDGSNRPDEQTFIRAFGEVYDRVAHDNIARIAEFLPVLCRDLRLSPWAASLYVQQHARLLSDSFSFGFAVGGKPSSVDLVIAGSLMEFEEVPVPLDRIDVGGRPALTLERVRR